MNQLAEPMAPETEQWAGQVTCGISDREIPADEALRVSVWVSIRSKSGTWESNVNIPVAPEHFGMLRMFQDDPLIRLKQLATAHYTPQKAKQPPPPDGAPEAEQGPSAAPSA